jgi:hypothetical protein
MFKYLLRSGCFKYLIKSKTMWGLMFFLAAGLVFTWFGKWTAESVDYFKWLGVAFFGSRGLDNATNIVHLKGDQ